ncbi:peptidase M48, Ste24p, partial [Baffinella frigidus]
GRAREQAVYLENLSTSIRVGPNQLPRIHASVLQALKVLNLEDCPVEVFVKQNSQPNAYTMAMQGKKPFIVIHSSLVDLMTEAELQAVIAHELGHLKCEHGIFITMANLLTIAAESLPFVSLFSDAIRGSMMQWMQAAELTCDRAALLVSQDPKVVVSVIMKLTGGSRSFASDLNPDAFLKQARDFEEESNNSWIGRRMAASAAQVRTHPLPVTRVQELDKWSQSPEYLALLQKGVPLKPLPPAPL